MDGLPGLETVFAEEFPQAKIQRCQVHVARNVLAKVPRKLKEPVADDMRSIFYASTKKKAWAFQKEFEKKWKRDIPLAVKCPQASAKACLTFMDFPQDEWISLRTTNVIERLNKEFKRRTKPMEIVPGEEACYRLLAFVSMNDPAASRGYRVSKFWPLLRRKRRGIRPKEIEDGTALAINTHRKSQRESSLLQADQRGVNSHNKLYTTIFRSLLDSPPIA